MNIIKWATHEDNGIMVKMTSKEAIRLIRSLAQQIEENGREQGRAKFWTDDNEYFSIAVVNDEKPYPDICDDCGNWLSKCMCDTPDNKKCVICLYPNIDCDCDLTESKVTQNKEIDQNET